MNSLFEFIRDASLFGLRVVTDVFRRSLKGTTLSGRSSKWVISPLFSQSPQASLLGIVMTFHHPGHSSFVPCVRVPTVQSLHSFRVRTAGCRALACRSSV